MPTIGVEVVVIHAGRVLLTRREDLEVWGLPGGQVEPGESVAACAIREVREETGLDVGLTRLVGVYSCPNVNVVGNHAVVFAAEPLGGELRPDPGEAVEARYFDPRDLPADLIWWHRQRIADAVSGRREAVAWRQDVPWPFEAQLTRQELYAIRDQQEEPRSELYRRHFSAPGPRGEVLEVGAPPPLELASSAKPLPCDVDFNPVAQAYDAYRTGYSDRLFRWILGDDDPSVLRVLDVGTGTGIVALELARRGARVVGIDPAEEMLARGRARARAEGLAVEFIPTTAEAFGADPASFDRIVCGQAFHWLDPDVVCPRWRTLLRPGGRIAVFRKDELPGQRASEIVGRVFQAYSIQPFNPGGPGYQEPFSDAKFPDLMRHFPDGYPLVHCYDQTFDVRRLVGFLASLGRVKHQLGDRHAAFLAAAEAALRAEFDDREFTIRYQDSLYLVDRLADEHRLSEAMKMKTPGT